MLFRSAPLKKAYGRQVEDLMRNRITHITKTEFLPCFIAAFNATITESNIQGGFRGAGLVPFDPEAVISKLDVRLRTPTPPLPETTPWESKTPRRLLEFGSQSTLVSEKIVNHGNSSPTSMLEAMKSFAKGAEIMAHRVVLLEQEISALRAAKIGRAHV